MKQPNSVDEFFERLNKFIGKRDIQSFDMLMRQRDNLYKGLVVNNDECSKKLFSQIIDSNKE